MQEITFSNHITTQDARKFRGVWCDAHLWFYTGANVMEKMFYLEIDSLDNENGCFASNEHFSKFSGLSKSRCSEIIKSLEQKGAISVELIYKIKNNKKSKQIEKRIIRVIPAWERAIRNEYERQCDIVAESKKEQRKIVEPPTQQDPLRDSEEVCEDNLFDFPKTPFGKSKDKEYNIYNTDLNNNIIKTTTTKEKLKPKKETTKAVSEVVVVDMNNNDITNQLILAYKEHFGRKPMNKTLQSMAIRVKRFEWDVIEDAFQKASAKGKALDYALGILKIRQENNAFTIDEVFEYDQRRTNISLKNKALLI